MRRTVTLVVSTAVGLAAIAYFCTMLPRVVTDPQDFRAFYCAGSAAREGRDPYRALPLGECEDRLIESDGASPLPGLVVPAPLPGYVVPVFEALSLLPFRVALGAFSLGILAAYLCAGICLTKLTLCDPWVVAASLAFGGVLLSLTNGQIVPFALAAICAAALATQRGEHRRAAICALGAAIEPHVGVAVLLSLAVRERSTRLPIAVGSALLGGLAVATLGVGRCAEYLARVLPAQTGAEIRSSDQYSVTALLHVLGFSDRTALTIGDAQYAITLVAAVACARAVANATGKRDVAVTLPAAFALLGGPYIHLVQMVLAVPLSLSLATMPQTRKRAGAALLLLAVPWRDAVANDPAFAALAIAVVTLAIGFAFVSRAPARLALLCCAMLALGAAERAVLEHRVHTPWNAAAGIAARHPDELAERSWRAYVDSVGSGETAAAHLAASAPTWIGLLLGVWASAGLLTRPRIAVREARPAASAENARC